MFFSYGYAILVLKDNNIIINRKNEEMESVFRKNKNKIHIHVETDLTEEQTQRLKNCIIRYSVFIILWNWLAPRILFSYNEFTMLVFYFFMNPIALLVVSRLFCVDNEGESTFALVIFLIEIIVCFLVSGLSVYRMGPDVCLVKYGWILIFYFICGKLGMKLH